MSTLKNIRSRIKWTPNKTELIELAAAVYLGTVLQRYLESIVDGILMPILHKVLPIDILHKKLMVMNINLSPVLTNSVSMIMALILVYMVLAFKWTVSKKI